MERLLQPDPGSRLGGQGPASLRHLKRHPWFAAMNWDALVEHRWGNNALGEGEGLCCVGGRLGSRGGGGGGGRGSSRVQSNDWRARVGRHELGRAGGAQVGAVEDRVDQGYRG